jgi:DNA-directed RNA polymerase beta subunit
MIYGEAKPTGHTTIDESKLPVVPANELFREFLSVNGLDPFNRHNSSSRKQMFASHIGQSLVIKGATERRCQTGMERQYAKYTFSIKMPVDGEIIKIVDRYRPKAGIDSITKPGDSPPQTIVFYENFHTKEIGMIDITTFCSFHQYFGFEYKATINAARLRQGEFIKAGDILFDSPSITAEGGYKYGIELKIAYMTMPGVSEDGIIICEDVLPKLAFKTYARRIVEYGSKSFPLNLYGTADVYKPHPDIGDVIRPDGLLAATRAYNTRLSVVQQSKYDLMEPDFIFDKLTYAEGAGGKVVDIKVHHDHKNTQALTPVGMDTQTRRYDKARREFYTEIMALYRFVKARHGINLNLTPQLHNLIVEAISVVGETDDHIMLLHRQAPLDDFRIEFIIEYEITPTIGFKGTDTHGGKGVICKIVKREHMPVDADGNSADIVMDPNSTWSRMNLGRLYEQFYNASGRDVVKRIARDFGIDEGDPNALAKLRLQPEEAIQRAWEYVVNFYAIVAPRMAEQVRSGLYAKHHGTREGHLASLIEKGAYLFIPPEDDTNSVEIVQKLQEHYRPTYGPVSYVGNSGNRVTTKDNVRIGSIYFILLEKIGDDWTAVSSGKVQHYGFLSQVTNADKYSQPTRVQAIRALGESEVRIYISYASPHITAEILDRNNNPTVHKMIVNNILEADTPTNIPLAVDRSIVPLGASKPLQLVDHILVCGGIRFKWAKHIPPEQPPAVLH